MNTRGESLRTQRCRLSSCGLDLAFPSTTSAAQVLLPLRAGGQLPSTKRLSQTHLCHLGARPHPAQGRAIARPPAPGYGSKAPTGLLFYPRITAGIPTLLGSPLFTNMGHVVGASSRALTW